MNGVTIPFKPVYRAKSALLLALIAAIAVVLAAIIASAATIYQTRHNNYHLSAGETHTLQFHAGASVRSATFDMTPHTGTVYFSLKQNNGVIGYVNVYQVAHKHSSHSSYTTASPTQISIKENKVYTAAYFMRDVKKYNTYNVIVRKIMGFEISSEIDFDWLLENPDMW